MTNKNIKIDNYSRILKFNDNFIESLLIFHILYIAKEYASLFTIDLIQYRINNSVNV